MTNINDELNEYDKEFYICHKCTNFIRDIMNGKNINYKNSKLFSIIIPNIKKYSLQDREKIVTWKTVNHCDACKETTTEKSKYHLWYGELINKEK